MKCPKCGYVSFNYLDQCKKCGKDLVLFKEEKRIWGIKPGNLKLYPLSSRDSPLESLDLSAGGEMGPAIVTVAARETSPILEESAQEVSSELEAIEFTPQEGEEPIEPLEALVELGEEAYLEPEDQEELILEEEIVLEEEDAWLDTPSPVPEGPSLILEESAQEVSSELEAIEFTPQESEEPTEPLEALVDMGEEAYLEPGDQEELILEEEPAGLDISLLAEEGEDKDTDVGALDLMVSAELEEESGPFLLSEEAEQDIQLDLEADEEPLIFLSGQDEATEEPIILLEEKDQPEEEEGKILLGLEDSTDELKLLLDEDEEEEETK